MMKNYGRRSFVPGEIRACWFGVLKKRTSEKYRSEGMECFGFEREKRFRIIGDDNKQGCQWV